LKFIMTSAAWRSSFALSMLFLLQGCSRTVTEIDLIMPVLPVDQAIARQIQALVDEESGFRINLVPLPEDFTSELDALESGYGDIAFAPNNSRYREAIATIMPLYPSVLHIASYGDREAASLEDLLAGASVYAGPPGSGPRLLSEDIVDDLYFAPRVVSFMDEWDTQPDVIILYVPIDRERITNNAQLTGARMFSMGSPGDIGLGSAVDRAVLFNPSLRPFVIPIGTYGDLTPEPIVTLAVDNILVARNDMEDTEAYDLFAEMLHLRPALFSERPELFQPLDELISEANFTFGLHPGVLSFLQRDEPTYIERYSGVAELLVTLLISSVSGLFAMKNIYRIRRKNRIDEFYLEAIKIRDSVTPETTADELAAAISAIHALKNRAFELLVDERLAADQSFQVFIELTRDALDEINKHVPGKSS
jgi:TRAP-type uncharacterized transport system substrate-binding protein